MKNRNLRHVRDAIKAQGGQVIKIVGASKHLHVYALTADGKTVRLVISKGISEPYKVKGWVRQNMSGG